MYMCIFNKNNGAHPQSITPLNNVKKFFNMSKIITINPVLQRNGQKNSHALYNLRDTKNYKLLG